MTPADGAGAGLRNCRAYVADLRAAVGGRRLAVALALVLGASVLDSASLLMLVPVLQLINGGTAPAAPAVLALVGSAGKPGLGAALGAFTALVLVRAWVGRQRDVALLALRLDYVGSLRSRLQAALAWAAWTHLVRLRHAHVMHLLFEQLDRIDRGTQQLMQALSGVGLGLAGVLVAMSIAPGWTLALALPTAALLWGLRGRLAASAGMGAEFGRGRRDMMAAAHGFLSNLKLVKAHAAEHRQLAGFDRRDRDLQQAQLRFVRHQAATRGSFELGGALLLASLLYAGSRWGGVTLAELLLIVLVFARLLPLLRDGQLQAQHLSHMLPAFADLQRAIDDAAAAAEREVDADALALTEDVAGPAPSLRGELRLEAVDFRYSGARAPVICALSLTLAAGTTTVLMGESGCGKTTTGDLLLGLLKPDAGSVLVDGIALTDDAARRRWRRHTAYVPQETDLFPGTLRENLCWLSGERCDDDVWAALAQADASTFVSAWPDGLDHPLGERGQGLSGGERQRIGLARALLCRPLLLVLDEVTSHLDDQSEGRVLAALATLAGRVTVLLIAHRPAAARHADRVIVLGDGRLLSDSAAPALPAPQRLVGVQAGRIVRQPPQQPPQRASTQPQRARQPGSGTR